MPHQSETSARHIAGSIFQLAVIVVFALALSAVLKMGIRAVQHNIATARCNDGSFSLSFHAQSACSYHGGVNTWLNHPSAHAV